MVTQKPARQRDLPPVPVRQKDCSPRAAAKSAQTWQRSRRTGSALDRQMGSRQEQGLAGGGSRPNGIGRRHPAADRRKRRCRWRKGVHQGIAARLEQGLRRFAAELAGVGDLRAAARADIPVERLDQRGSRRCSRTGRAIPRAAAGHGGADFVLADRDQVAVADSVCGAVSRPPPLTNTPLVLRSVRTYRPSTKSISACSDEM